MTKEQERAELEIATARWLKEHKLTILPPSPDFVQLDRVAVSGLTGGYAGGRTNKTSHHDGWENVTKF